MDTDMVMAMDQNIIQKRKGKLQRIMPDIIQMIKIYNLCL